MKCQILIEHVLELIFDYFDISKTILDKILLQQPILYFVILVHPVINGQKFSVPDRTVRADP